MKHSLSIMVALLLFCTINSSAEAIPSTIDSNKINQTLLDLGSKSYTKELHAEYIKLAKQADQIQYKAGMANANLWLGNFAVEQGEIDNAINHYKIVDKISKELKDSSLLLRANSSFGFLFNSIGEYEKAIDKNLIAKDIAMKTNQKEHLAIIENGLGVIYAKMENYSKSILSFEASKKIFIEIDDKDGIEGCNYNIAETRINQGHPELAFGPAFETVKYYKNSGSGYDLAYSYQLLAKAFLASNDWNQAIVYADSSLQISNENKLNFLDLETFPLLVEAYDKKGDIEKSYYYFKQFHKADKEFFDESTNKNLAELEIQYETEKNEKELIKSQTELKQLEQTAKIRKLGLWMLIGGIFMAALSAYSFFTKLKAKAREKEANEKLILSDLKNKELEANQLQSKLSNKESDLTNLALDISRKNEYSYKIISKLEELQKTKPDEIKDKIRELTLYTSNQLQINDDAAVLHSNVDIVNQEFYQRLETRFGKLTSNEKYLTGLIRLNLANKEIAAIKGISTTSVKTSRHRLRKRLRLEPQMDIVDFLQKV